MYFRMHLLSMVAICFYFCASTEPFSIGVCVVVGENSIKDIREWVDYHSFIGMKNFYIYNHSPNPDVLTSTLEPFIANGIVKIRDIPATWRDQSSNIGIPEECGPKIQCWALSTCAREYRHQHDFMASIDVDEFILMRNKESLNSFLRDYKDTGGLLLHWRYFGSSGFVQRPVGGVLRNYVKCNDNEILATAGRLDNPRGYTKSITSTKAITDQTVCNPHVCLGIEYYDENMSKDYSKVSFSKVSLNHYKVKSRCDFISKRKAMKAIGGIHDESYFIHANLHTNDSCIEASIIARKIPYKP